MEEDSIQLEQSWRVTSPDKWDVIDSGKWIQKVEWNRMVTVSERDQPHKTPVTSTWTTDFLTREGEGLKAMGDWLRDNRCHGKPAKDCSKRMRALSRVRVVSKNGGSIRTGSVTYGSAAGSWAFRCLVEDPSTAPLSTSRAVCVGSKTQRSQVLTTPVSNRYKTT